MVEACEDKIKEETAATCRCMPFDQTPVGCRCVRCGKQLQKGEGYVAYFAKAY